MRIDGKAIAEITLTDLTRQVTNLKKGVTPTLAVIQVGTTRRPPHTLTKSRKRQSVLGPCSYMKNFH